MKKGESILSGKILVTCTVTIFGLWSHCGTGEEWADGDNSMTSADAQAFKRACSCFGLGRYFYDFPAMWVDLDQNRQIMKTPVLFGWALPENWRKGTRPPGKNGNGSANVPHYANSPNGSTSNKPRQTIANQSRSANGRGNGHTQPERSNSPSGGSGDNLDERIVQLEKAVGTALYRGILSEYGRVNQPKLIRDLPVKRKVLQVLESATRGLERLEAVVERLDPDTVRGLLDKLQVPPLNEITDLKTLQSVVLGLEELAGQN